MLDLGGFVAAVEGPKAAAAEEGAAEKLSPRDFVEPDELVKE